MTGAGPSGRLARPAARRTLIAVAVVAGLVAGNALYARDHVPAAGAAAVMAAAIGALLLGGFRPGGVR